TVSETLSFSATRVRAKDTALSLQGMDVGQIAWFDHARFAGKVDAIGLHVGHQLSWNNVVTINDVDFYELDVKRGAFLRSAKFGGAFKIDRACLAADMFLSGVECRGPVTFVKSNISALFMGRDEPPHDRPAVLYGGLSLQYTKLGQVGLRGVKIS